MGKERFLEFPHQPVERVTQGRIPTMDLFEIDAARHEAEDTEIIAMLEGQDCDRPEDKDWIAA